MNRASILTFSQSGNTLKVGAAIAEALSSAQYEVDHVRFRQRRRWQPGDADLVGVGGPVFENRPAEVLTEYLDSAGLDLAGKDAFVFITSGGSPAQSLWHLARALERTGARVIGGVKIRGSSTVPTLAAHYPGRPNEADLRLARSFGRSVAAVAEARNQIEQPFRIGPRKVGDLYDWLGPVVTFAKKKLVPLPIVNHDQCDLCGICARECPSTSIRVRNSQVQVSDACIRCYRCWHVCPPMAIEMKMSPLDGLAERLVYSELMERAFGDVERGELVGRNRYRDVIARRLRLRYDKDAPSAEFHQA